MQRVIQRTQRASNAAKRKAQRVKANRDHDEGWRRRVDNRFILQDHANIARESKRNYKEDWALGLLAPNRAAGEKENAHGSMPVAGFQNTEQDPEKRPKWWHIATGDRVVVTRGRDRGKIGEVREVGERTATVTVKGVNLFYIDVPPFMRQGGERVRSGERGIPIEDVRLVFPLPDPTTGIPRDVVIDQLVQSPEGGRLADETAEKSGKPDRLIAGTNTIIPWPKYDFDQPGEAEGTDTQADWVDYITFSPTLVEPPFPDTVIDELRNKYSRFRTRHSEEYVAGKEAEDARTGARAGLIKNMRTPLQELKELQKQKAEERRAKQQLTEEQLAKIGEMMIQEKSQKMGRVSEA